MTKKREKPLHLDMSFDEALKRFAQADLRDLAKRAKKARKKPKRTSADVDAAEKRDDTY